MENRNVPRHIGIIMDGNGRWAKLRGLPRSEGHKAGANAFRRICDYACEIGIESITFYAFSTENWRRPPEEVSALMDLFRDYLHEAEDRQLENIEKGMHIRFIGHREGVPEDILDLFDSTEEGSKSANRINVNLAVNYGGRLEIVDAVKVIAQKVKNGELNPEDITEDDISKYVYTAGQADPDLIIRPSGEYRLSNFLLWQSAYSEFWFSDILWPDFTTEDLDRAIDDFNNRNRRFGGI
ncbi:MAG: isoprenyl transferase [Ruminococcus sp.]|nr:isoprenyl transferase [Candidatus Copronaster equi]